MRHPSYFGIAGISHSREVKALLKEMPTSMLASSSTHKLAIGVLATASTLDGKPASKPKRYAPTSEWRTLVVPPKAGFTLLHFGWKSGSADSNLARVALPGEYKGIQWNAPLEAVAKEEHQQALACWAGLRVVLQLRIEDKPDVAKLIDIARAHKALGAITDVLLDASAGKGKPMDHEYTEHLIRRFADWFGNELGVGVAGGIKPGKIDHVRRWLRTYPWLSVDIESGVRTEDDDFDPIAAAELLAELVAT